ncbi:MAG: BrnT family toxin [Ignavibacteriaceae bacterium]|nr:BrnT family toxin [Ignavibacteriaceae bacterium]
MKHYDWDDKKNEFLKKNRGISFEIIVSQIELGKLLVITKHQNPEKYPNQKIYVVEYENYAYLVPFVEDEEKVFLKTIIPSRKATKKYI